MTDQNQQINPDTPNTGPRRRQYSSTETRELANSMAQVIMQSFKETIHLAIEMYDIGLGETDEEKELRGNAHALEVAVTGALFKCGIEFSQIGLFDVREEDAETRFFAFMKFLWDQAKKERLAEKFEEEEAARKKAEQPAAE